MTTRLVFAMMIAVIGMGIATNARAGKLDVNAGGFIACNSTGVCYPEVSDYETFLAEYAFGLAPNLLSPADTLGYAGFYVGVEGTFSPRPPGNATLWKKATPADGNPELMFVPKIHIRKGLPWSFEIGATFSYLAQSRVVAIGGEIKWSLFEGFHHRWKGALPDVAVRGTVNRIVGQPEIDMTLVGVDGSISYTLGLGGTVTLTPYTGYQYIWTFARIEPFLVKYVDEDGDVVKYVEDSLSDPNLGRHKLFLGIRFTYEILCVTAEVGWGLKSTWDTDVDPNIVDDNDNSQASVGNQVQYSLGVGVDF
ncbi:MAG: hypothetical protein GY762_13060 [Proteobacteria bacterium]|nr:hypothetical protein [Pseudomonadota bacterium]